MLASDFIDHCINKDNLSEAFIVHHPYIKCHHENEYIQTQNIEKRERHHIHGSPHP